MKIKSFLVAALAAMTISSCSSDDHEGGNLPEGKGEATTMGLSFTLPKAPGTRAGDTVEGTEKENAINTISVFIFNKSDGTAADGNNTALTINDFSEADGTYTLLNSKAIETSTGVKNIYIGANLPTEYQNFDSESELKTAKDMVAELAVKGGNVAFFSNVESANLVTQEEGTLPIANKVSANLLRMVAKVVAQNTKAQYTSTLPIGENEKMTITYTIADYGIGQQATHTYTTQVFNGGGKLLTPGTVTGKPTDMSGVVLGKDDVYKTTGNYFYIGENAPGSMLQGEATYVMVRSQAGLSHHAVVEEGAIVWKEEAYTGTFWIVLDSEDNVYFCKEEATCSSIATVLINKGVTSRKLEYKNGYVYFRVLLNPDTDNKFAVERNQFVHVKITGVKDDVFGGMPGEGEDGKEAPDPKDPENPKPIDPTDPIEDLEAYLIVEVEVLPWTYAQNNVELE